MINDVKYDNIKKQTSCHPYVVPGGWIFAFVIISFSLAGHNSSRAASGFAYEWNSIGYGIHSM